MDLELDETQRSIQDSLQRLFERSAGPARARALRKADAFDRPLLEEVRQGGFLDLFADSDTGPLAAALVTEWSAQAAVLAPIGNRVLTAPAVIEGDLPLVIAVADAESLHAVRYGAEADLLIVVDGHDARAAEKGAFSAESVRTKFGYPMARVRDVKGKKLAAGAGALVKAWQRVAIAAEIAGTARAALELTIRYLRDRVQFDRPIASFQAVQHRLVECHVSVDAAQWAAREAAYHGAPAALAASAAISAGDAAQRVFFETHQLTGAMGFTIEYDLHLFTMRLQALRYEMQGLRGHARDLVAARWGGNA